MVSLEAKRRGIPGEDVEALPAEWELLKQVRHELEGWKAELKANAHKRLEMGAGDKQPPLTVGQVVEQRLFYIYVDRPVAKERITTRLQRTFYEREYVRVTKLVNEVQQPTTIEPLSRETLLLGDGGAKGAPVAIGAPAGIAEGKGEHSSGAPPARTPTHNGLGDTVPADGVRGGREPGVQEVQGGRVADRDGGSEGKRPFRNPFTRGSGKGEANPFKGFVQPAQAGGELPSSQALRKQESKKKPRSKLSLRWCFTAPFTSDGAISQQHRSQTKVEVLSQGSTPDPASSDGGPANLTDTGSTTRQNGHLDSCGAGAVRQHGGGAGSGTVGTGGGTAGIGGGAPGSGDGSGALRHEAAVKAALQAGEADASQHETFTRVEEVAVTTETIERFVVHNYFQREYVIAVIYKGETLSPPTYEILSRDRYLKPSTGASKAT